MHRKRSWCGHLCNGSLNLSQASLTNSPSLCWKLSISLLYFAFLLGGIYFIKNVFARSAQVVINSTGNEFNEVQALSCSKNDNNFCFSAYLVTPLIFNKFLTFKKYLKWRWGFSDAWPLNHSIVWSIWNITSSAQTHLCQYLGSR